MRDSLKRRDTLRGRMIASKLSCRMPKIKIILTMIARIFMDVLFLAPPCLRFASVGLSGSPPAAEKERAWGTPPNPPPGLRPWNRFQKTSYELAKAMRSLEYL